MNEHCRDKGIQIRLFCVNESDGRVGRLGKAVFLNEVKIMGKWDRRVGEIPPVRGPVF